MEGLLPSRAVEPRPGHFDHLIEPFVGPTIDFCSIDIDGPDLEVFESFAERRPDVVCIEGGQMLPPRHPRLAPEIARHNLQQSLGTMVAAFAARGYALIAAHQDAFFVKRELAGPFAVCDDIDAAYLRGVRHHPRRVPWIRRTLAELGLCNPLLDRIIASAAVPDVASGKQWSEAETARVVAAVEAEMGVGGGVQ